MLNMYAIIGSIFNYVVKADEIVYCVFRPYGYIARWLWFKACKIFAMYVGAY